MLKMLTIYLPLQQTLMYEATGEGSALSYFMIDQTGRIILMQSLRNELQTTYRVCVHSLRFST